MAAVDPTKTLVLLYEPRYHHASGGVFQGLKEKFGERKLVLGTMKTFYDPTEQEKGTDAATGAEKSSTSVLRIGGQDIVVESDNCEVTPETYSLFGRKSYLFVVGKVNVPKLANYAEIDAFVLVACHQNTLMDSKEYYKPIITPYELQLALSPNEEWDGQYKTDFGEVVPALEKTAQSVEQTADDGEDEDADKPFFSLVSGTYKTSSRAIPVDRETATYALTASEKPDATTALQVKNQRTELTTYHSEAADFLATREYQGLDPRIGKTPAHAAVEGSTGIARGYTHETE
ncbi:unnamed protein product [Phytophthora fragariaefolia]|uniref:Unnamed protein product n=1 Tax=Phytophthora fragariaefolia TaxID=1490495 RepID=A0A9W6XP26_9STRA|nr:unnamed protein product [Phytophthora fragariaefolia]